MSTIVPKSPEDRIDGIVALVYEYGKVACSFGAAEGLDVPSGEYAKQAANLLARIVRELSDALGGAR